MIIARNIKRLRIKENWMQEDLAREVGVSVGAVINWEGGGIPDPVHMQVIAAVFRVTVEELTFSEIDQELGEFEEKYNTAGSRIVSFLLDEIRLKNEIIRALLDRLTSGRS